MVEYAGDVIVRQQSQLREEIYSMDHTQGCYMFYFKWQNNKSYW